MSRVYDNWEKLVEAVLKREHLRRLALCESFSSSISADFSSRFSFASSLEDVPDYASRLSFDAFIGDGLAGLDRQMDQAGSSNPYAGLRRKLDVRPDSTNSGEMFEPADPSSQNIFFWRNKMAIEFKEIKKATRNFQSNMLLGEGGFSPVYKGWIHEHHLTAVKPGSGIAVAVKKLGERAFQGHREWLMEINYLSQLRHPNLVKLIGYSFKEDNRILVYEFMPKGSLDNHLFKRGHQSLSWATRIKVATGAARGLSFLHDLEIPVIYRNVKCGDILLDDEFNAKLSDFCLARDGPTGDMTHVSTRVMGTYGYAAPEYVATGCLTTKCDVFGFGVVLLELLSGLRVIDKKRPRKEQNLVEWAKPYLGDKRKLLRIMDTKLEGEYDHNEAYTVAKLALQCLSSVPKLRPMMPEVVAALEQL